MHSNSARLVLLSVLVGCGTPVAPSDAGPGDASRADTGAPDAAVAAACDVTLPSDLATTAHWDTEFTIAGLTGYDGVTPIVRDVAPAPDGSAIVVGYFHWAGTTRVEGVARLTGHALAPLAEAATLPLATEGYAAALVAPDGAIYLAPYRRTESRTGTMIRIDGTGVHAIGTFTGNVRSLALVDGALWALGTLAIDGGPHGIAIYEAGAWHGVTGGDPDGPAYEVLVRASGDLVVGGEFSTIGGVASERVARWDGSAWTAMSAPEAGRVIALAEDASATLWAGGVFSLGPDGIASGSLARWTGTAWGIAEGGVSASDGFGAVSDLLVDDGGLVVLGCFDHVGGTVRADGIARLSGTTWTAIDDGTRGVASHWFAPFVCGFEPDPAVVWEIPRQRATPIGDAVVIGGAFGGIDGVASQSVIALEQTGFVALGTSGRGVSGQVLDLDVGGPDCEVVALVAASHVGGAPREAAVYRLDDSGWHPEGAPLPAGTHCLKVALDGRGVVHLACSEDGPTPADPPLGSVLRATSTGWRRVGDATASSVMDVVTAPDGSVWSVVSAEHGQLVRVDDDALSPIGPELDGFTVLLAFGPPRGDGTFDAFAGGTFMNAGTVAATRIARWDGTAWSALGDGLSSTPSALAAGDGVVYAGTQDEGNAGRLVLGRFDGSTWSDIGTPAHGLAAPYMMTTHTFTSLAMRADILVATGYVWPDGQGRNAFVFANDQFSALAGGASAISVDALAITASTIVIGGSIAEVGSGAGTLPSIGVARARF